MRRFRFWRPLVHLWYRLFRSDVFISYTRSDRGRHYSHALATALGKRKFRPLMDTFEARMGLETPEELLDQMRHCMQLVVVASPGAMESVAVAQEVELFPKRGRSIVLLEFDQDVRGAPWYRKHLAGIPPVPAGEPAAAGPQRGGLRVVECEEGLMSRPAEATVDLIVDAFVYKRARFRQALIAVITAALFVVAGGTLAKVWSEYRLANRNLANTRTQLGAEQDKLQEEQNKLQEEQCKTELAISERKTAEEGARASEAVAKREAEAARVLGEKAQALDGERMRAEEERGKAIIERDGERAKVEAAKISLAQAQREEKVVRTRLAAMGAMESDPYLAYRLAEHLYDMKKSEEHESLLRKSASRARFPYEPAEPAYPGCGFMGSTPPWVLLACWDIGRRVDGDPVALSSGTFRVVNIETGRTEGTLPWEDLRSGWIVRRNSSWRVVAVRWEKRDDWDQSYPVAYGWDPPPEKGGGVPVELLRHASLKSCGGDNLSWTYRAGEWNLLVASTGRLITIDHLPGDTFLACREDGRFLIARSGGLESFSAAGVSEGVKGWADPGHRLRIEEPAGWSPDGRYLAGWRGVRGGKTLMVLDVATGQVSPASPDKHLDNAFRWRDQHTLISAGHTLDEADYEITSFDTQSGVRQRLRTHGAGILDLEILPNGMLAILDEPGVVEVVSLPDDVEAWRGYHKYATNLRSTGRFLLTYGFETRQWPIQPAAANWIFRSTRDYRYTDAVGEPTNTWLAATLQETSGKKRKMIELRRVKGGEPVRLDITKRCSECDAVVFSRDGRWLFAVSRGKFVIFRTRDQQCYEFPADDNDRRFYYIRVEEGRVQLFNNATGKTKVYEFDVRGEEPLRKEPTDEPKEWLNRDCAWPAFGERAGRVEGWEPLLAAGPADRETRGCRAWGWAAYVVQRNEGRWDFEMIPGYGEQVKAVFDGMVPRKEPEELEKIVQGGGDSRGH
jgi:hypothetical protein